MKKIFVVGNSTHYTDWLTPLGYENTKFIDDADVVMFTGGEDVNPALYGDVAHRTTGFNKTRDEKEIIAFRRARELNKPCVGVCRGSQFVCVMSGGKLIQDVTNHGMPHTIRINAGNNVWKTIDVVSTHHQMQYPYIMNQKDYEILGYSDSAQSAWYLNGKGNSMDMDDPTFPVKDVDDFVEPEVVYYRNTNCLGIQTHPEMMINNPVKYKEGVETLQALFKNFINNKL